MPLVDRSLQPQPPARKTKGVKIVRSEKDGRMVSVRTVSADSNTLGDDLRYVFSQNVRAVTKKK